MKVSVRGAIRNAIFHPELQPLKSFMDEDGKPVSEGRALEYLLDALEQGYQSVPPSEDDRVPRKEKWDGD